MERVSSDLQVFSCFSENFKFKFRLIAQYLKTHQYSKSRLLWSVGKGKYFMQFFAKSWTYRLIKLFQAAKNLSMVLQAFQW